ncbi:hypothetical protein PHSY_004854 [Pseudozyma hubeiensis SY62]|uniref:Uncharacterized protein n=1 Tax=Pseudozyma hubeiensis (strain SY62) TaxID=1305764 RepID=R9P7F7_PSEHS|nr:hypothetical protein PHSY_004854 [Pseudozyma hubeiensis SY62]GAC97269.1 hypothetical protein PHSY_004854 [Pseudozyma hubeiensis SY62]
MSENQRHVDLRIGGTAPPDTHAPDRSPIRTTTTWRWLAITNHTLAALTASLPKTYRIHDIEKRQETM